MADACTDNARKLTTVLYDSAAGAEIELTSQPRREQRLKEAVKQTAHYDYIQRRPPSLGIDNECFYGASDTVLIPVQCEYYALEGLSQ